MFASIYSYFTVSNYTIIDEKGQLIKIHKFYYLTSNFTINTTSISTIKKKHKKFLIFLKKGLTFLENSI